ncbi:hypothetical protein SAMN05443634_107282 [Chishuiella changwenlii]|uniref:DUF5689 domain-containing protein n=1 Tax=Chishuiella changwenlii TaxID=1434701 RepID=A0A1M6ZEF3_9FLAO|nr:DUF5689 domain-containing protein [Chishuiella changwenlii]GGE86277.1 hypothetical protein GCM10010984_00110 [Chishuiella changwenlii]SHL28886.1 hypothetical protein SAMN05443634_107282 [Chishuiella changwenlii]
MNTISKLTIAGVLSLGLFITQSCVQDDDYATPPIECADKLVANITLPELLTKINSNQIQLDSNGAVAEDLVFDAYVISSDETGNFYKTISMQDKVKAPTAGIQIEIDGTNLYTEYAVGSRVQVNLKGLVVARDRGIMKIGSVDPTYAVGRIPSANMKKYLVRTCDPIQTIEPKVVANLTEALKAENLNLLVTINNVQFQDPEGDKTYGVAATTVNRLLIDKSGKTVDLRNSGYAKWYNDALPTTSGAITVVVSIYNSTYQLYIRDTNDVKFDQPRFETGGGTNPGEGNNQEAANLFFKGSDFNNWTDFLASLNSFKVTAGLAVQGTGTGRDGSNSFYLNGTTGTTNPYVFTATAGTLTIPENATKITMWVKGSAAKSLSFNLDTTSGRVFYNVGDFGAANATFTSQSSNAYIGTFDTNGEWRLITLNIAGLTLVKTGDLFALKAGSNTKYDIHIDNIKID